MSSSDCIFCKIIAGEIPCAKIYETDDVLAFLDIAPVNRGHALVIPKKHQENIFSLDPELGKELIMAMKKVGHALLEETQADGLNIGMNNFEAAGQLVFHAHWHLIPRFKDDGLKLWAQNDPEDPKVLGELAARVAKRIV